MTRAAGGPVVPEVDADEPGDLGRAEVVTADAPPEPVRGADDRDDRDDREERGRDDETEAGDDEEPPDAEGAEGAGDPGPSRPRGGERPWSWHVLRVSGLLLAVLVPIHFAVTVIGGDVGDTDAGTMYQRFRNVRWRGFEWVVIGLALVHAVLAIRAAIERSDLAPVARRRLALVTTGAGGLLAAIAAWFLLTYR